MNFRMFRCTNPNCAAGDFEAKEAKCAACGCGAGMVIELVPVHYLVGAEGPIQTALGGRMIACAPNFPRLPKAATGSRRDVSCVRCKASGIFAEDERDGTDQHVPVIEQRIAQETGVAGVQQG